LKKSILQILQTPQNIKTNDDLLNFIFELPKIDNQIKLRTDRTTPKKVVDQYFPIEDRNISIEIFYNLLEKKFQTLVITKTSCPLYGCYGSPGSGKSTIIQELSKFPQLEKADSSVSAKLAKSVPITITFGYQSRFDYNSEQCDPIKEFCLRLLWSYYFECPFITFEKHFNYASPFSEDFILFSIQSIFKDMKALYKEKNHIFLFIDEIMFLGKEHAKKLLHSIGKTLDCCEDFDVFITTLDKVFLDECIEKNPITLSGRTICYINLPRLSYQTSLKLLVVVVIQDYLKLFQSTFNKIKTILMRHSNL